MSPFYMILQMDSRW